MINYQIENKGIFLKPGKILPPLIQFFEGTHSSDYNGLKFLLTERFSAK